MPPPSVPRSPAPVSPPAGAANPPPAGGAAAAAVADLIEAHRHQPGALLPLLHAIQDRLGHIPDAVVAPVATALNRSRAEVHGVLTYYHHFRRTPPGRHVVQICRAEACLACGADALVQAAEQLLDCPIGSTRADAGVTLEPVYCLGLCAQSPAALVDGQPQARLSPTRLAQLKASWEPGR